MLDEAVDEVGGHEGLAGARRHLHERARPPVREGLLRPLDGLGLCRPQVALVERRHPAEIRPKLLSRAGELHESLRLVEMEDVPAAGVRVEVVREPDLLAIRLICAEEWAAVRGEVLRQAVCVTRCLVPT